jgi:hypothetical protein
MWDVGYYLTNDLMKLFQKKEPFGPEIVNYQKYQVVAYVAASFLRFLRVGSCYKRSSWQFRRVYGNIQHISPYDQAYKRLCMAI